MQTAAKLAGEEVSLMTITQYEFPDTPASSGFCVFPEELEQDNLVFFHATSAGNRDAIFEGGFRIPDPTGQTGLTSVSFSKQSLMALDHAMTKRSNNRGQYSIIAVRYNSLVREGLTVNVSDIHDFTLDPAPEIIGYCNVPESYRHL